MLSAARRSSRMSRFPHYSEGMRMSDAEEHALRTLELLDAGNLAHRSTRELGLPERLIVELARAIVREPRLLLVDEPAVLSKPGQARAFYALLHSLPERIGCSLLIASEEVTPLRGSRPMMTLSGGQPDLHGDAAEGDRLPRRAP